MDQKKTGCFLKQLRNEKGLTQEQLANEFGVAQRTVSRWETGSNMPDISMLVEIAEFYEVDIREIIDGERKSESMKKEENQTENLDVLDILLDEENESPITLYDENDKAIQFDQVAIIPMEEKLFAILKPIDEMEGVSDDEAIVFRVDEKEDGENDLVIETDEALAMRVFDEFYRLLDEIEENQK